MPREDGEPRDFRAVAARLKHARDGPPDDDGMVEVNSGKGEMATVGVAESAVHGQE